MTTKKAKKTAKATKKTSQRAKAKVEEPDATTKISDSPTEATDTEELLESKTEVCEVKDVLCVKKLDPAAKLPVRAHPTDAGLDIFCLESFKLDKGERKSVRTGIVVSVPHGYYGRLAEKGGLANGKGLQVMAGVVDENYTGELLAVLFNPKGYVKGHAGKRIFDQAIEFKAGDKICQLVLEKISLAEVVEVDEIEDTDRGEGRFGSTGS